jgi:hypothetical protein
VPAAIPAPQQPDEAIEPPVDRQQLKDVVDGLEISHKARFNNFVVRRNQFVTLSHNPRAIFQFYGFRSFPVQGEDRSDVLVHAMLAQPSERPTKLEMYSKCDVTALPVDGLLVTELLDVHLRTLDGQQVWIRNPYVRRPTDT